MNDDRAIGDALVYSSGAGGVGGRSRMVSGGGVRASGLRSRISRGCPEEKEG